MAQQIALLATQVSSGAGTAASRERATAPSTSSSDACDPFEGNLNKCRRFLFQCSLLFQQRPHFFSSDTAKINYVIGLLRGNALALAEAMSAQHELCLFIYDEFETQFKAVFDNPSTPRILTVYCTNERFPCLMVEFWILAVEAGWNEPSLMGVFWRGLRGKLRDAVALRGRPKDLWSLIDLTTELDAYLNHQWPNPATFTSSVLPPHSPMSHPHTAKPARKSTCPSSVTSPQRGSN